VSKFEEKLAELLNSVSAENASNTPDFILAAYLHDCLVAFNRASKWREFWNSPDGVPLEMRDNGPRADRLP
jgi:hypothetical protein